jgi:predicted DsbA family dithiol-disulfide isomerase
MQVEIWSDVVCPWCYIGKRRFESALAQFPHRDQVQVTWRSFELDPQAPRQDDMPLAERLARKLGRTVEQAKQMHDHLTQLAAQEGLTYRFDLAKRGSTFDAHRLIHLAKHRGLQDAVKERLLKGYFTEGLPVGDPESLVQSVAEVGIAPEEARAVLASDAYAEDVRADEQRAMQFGIRGVPFIAIDETYGVSGAQPAAVFAQALQEAWSATHPLTMVGAAEGAGACEDDVCEVPTETRAR